MRITRRGGRGRVDLGQVRLDNLLRRATDWHGHFRKHDEGLESLLLLRQSQPTHPAIPELEYRYFEYHADQAIDYERRHQIPTALHHCQCVLRIHSDNLQFIEMKERLGGTMTKGELVKLAERRPVPEPAPAPEPDPKPEPAKPKRVKRKRRKKVQISPTISFVALESIAAYCSDYLERLQGLYPFLRGRRSAPFEQMPVMLLQERLVQMREVVAFLRKNGGLSFSGLKSKDPETAFLFDAKYNSRAVFNGIRVARVAAGLQEDRALLAQIKIEIKEAFEEATALSYENLQKKWDLWQQAEILFEQGEYEAAAKVFQQALKIDPDDLALLCHYYISRFKIYSDKRALRAIEMLERRIEGIKFLRENPDNSATSLRENNPRMLSLLTQGKESFGVFDRISDGRIAAGIVRDRDRLRQLGRKITKEYDDLIVLLTQKKSKDMELANAAEEAFDRGRYAQAAFLFGKLLKDDPDDVRAFAMHHFCALDWKYGFLVGIYPNVHTGFLNPAVAEYLSWYGTIEAIQKQVDVTERFLDPLYQQAQAGKEGWFENAEQLYKAGEYQKAADFCEKMLRECDPHNILTRSFYYFNLMHLRYSFIPQFVSTGKGVRQQNIPIARAATRLERRIGSIIFLNKHPELRHVADARAFGAEGKRVASSLGAHEKVRVFNGLREGNVAAGLIEDAPLLEDIIFRLDDEVGQIGINLVV